LVTGRTESVKSLIENKQSRLPRSSGCSTILRRVDGIYLKLLEPTAASGSQRVLVHPYRRLSRRSRLVMTSDISIFTYDWPVSNYTAGECHYSPVDG